MKLRIRWLKKTSTKSYQCQGKSESFVFIYALKYRSTGFL